MFVRLRSTLPRLSASLVVLLCAVGAWGQVTSRVIGVVADPSGSSIQAATVTLTNEGTGVSFTTTTTSAGTYVFDSVQVGTYTITVEREGFKKFVSTGNVLTIGQPMTVNVTMQVGQVTESVRVSAMAELVQTSTGGNIGNVVDEQTIQQLPIVGVRGRNPLNFINFQPGVTLGGNTGGGVNVNGSRDRAWNFTLDGIDINEDSAPGSNFSPSRTNPDSISELRLLTSNFTADYGRNSGGQVAMVTRSGTNQFHGDAFWFYQTPRLQANAFSNNELGIGKPQFVQHIYGGSVGGPIRKDKTFFFVNLQRLRTHETAQITSNVYTATARRGIFRYVTGGNCGSPCRNRPANSSGASVDTSGSVLAGVTVASYDVVANDPANRGLDPSVQKILNLTPLPNNFTAGDGLNVAGYSWSSPQTETQQDFTIRMDHTFSQRNSVFGRWYKGHQNTLGDIVNGGQAPFPNAPRVVDTERSPRNLAVGWRTIPSNSATNEFVLGMNRFTFNFANPDSNYLSNPPFNLGNVANPLQNYVGNLRALTTYQLADNFSWVRKAHVLKWGINFVYTRHIDRRGSVGAYNVQPAADFSISANPVDIIAYNVPTTMIDTVSDQPRLEGTINELLGRVGNYQQSFVAVGNQFGPAGTVYHFDARFPEYGFYGMDTWKLRHNLTLDLGLRWEVKLTPRDPRSRLSHPDQPFVVGAAPSQALNWVKGPLYGNAWGNLGPSLGVAWDPLGTGKTSLRADYRVAYDHMNTFSLSSGVFQSLPGQTYSIANTNFGQAGGRLADGLPILAPPSGVTPGSLTQPAPFSPTSIYVVDPNWKPAQVNEWSLSVERQLSPKMVLSVNYIGHHAVHLYGAYDSNQVNIFSNGFLDAFNTVAAGGDSPLMDNLLLLDPSRRVAMGETGSQEVRRLFRSQLDVASVAQLAQTISTRTTAAGVPVYVASGFSPYFFMPYPQFSGGLYVLDSNDYSHYHSLQVQLSRRFSPSLTYQLGYTWSHSLDSRSYDPTFTRVSRGANQSSGSTPFNIRNRALNYASSDFDRRHVFYGEWMWTLPFGDSQRWASHLNSAFRRIVGGWQASGVLTAASGRPFTVYSGAFTYSNDVQSPAICSGCSPNLGHLQLDATSGRLYLISPSQKGLFSAPPAGQLGTGRNNFTYPSYFNLDLALAKRTQIMETQSLEFRLEMTNATNTPQWEFMDSSVITSPSFGRESFPNNAARRIQLGLKYYF